MAYLFAILCCSFMYVSSACTVESVAVVVTRQASEAAVAETSS
jgi:hypothetical protein